MAEKGFEPTYIDVKRLATPDESVVITIKQRLD